MFSKKLISFIQILYFLQCFLFKNKNLHACVYHTFPLVSTVRVHSHLALFFHSSGCYFECDKITVAIIPQVNIQYFNLSL